MSASSVRYEDLFGLPQFHPKPKNSVFNTLQEELLDFRTQTRMAPSSVEEAHSLLDAGNKLMIRIRNSIMMMVRNSEMVSPEHHELIQLYNGVWDRLRKIESRNKLVKLLAADIFLEDVSELPTRF
jgi:hypothetical protein